MGDNQTAGHIHAGLGMVTLLEPATRGRHDPRCLIREIHLIMVPWPRYPAVREVDRRTSCRSSSPALAGLPISLRRPPARVPADAAHAPQSPAGPDGSPPTAFPGAPIPRVGPTAQAVRGGPPAPQAHQLVHLPLQLPLQRRTFPTQRLVPAGIRLDPGAVQTHRPQLQRPHLLGEHQNRQKQPLQFLQETLAKRVDAVVCWWLFKMSHL